MNRKYTYVRTMNIKSSDGTETLKTIKLNTPHEETHIMCTPAHACFPPIPDLRCLPSDLCL